MSDVHDWMRVEARRAEQYADGYCFDESRPSRSELAEDEAELRDLYANGFAGRTDLPS